MNKSNSGVKTAPAAGEHEEKNARFNELIMGEYKEQFNEAVQSILKERLAKLSETAERYEKLCPAMELLAESCGIDFQDADAFALAITSGLSADGKDMREKSRRERANRRYDNWLCQSGEAHAAYPEFDLTKELENEEFKALLRSSIPVKTAYEFVHRQEFMEKAASEMEKAILKKVFAENLRPREGALSASGGTLMNSDVSNMSKSTRQEIIRRVQRGEKISF